MNKNEIVKSETTAIALPKEFEQAAEQCQLAIQYSEMARQSANPVAKGIYMAKGVNLLLAALNDDLMRNEILVLKGSPLGFVCDNRQYTLNEIRSCIIDGLLSGVQLVGNQMNILCGRCYITKNGTEQILKNIPGLKYRLVNRIPQITGTATVGKGTQIRIATAKVMLSWEYGGVKDSQELEFEIKVNEGMTSDAINGKAERKAQAWLIKHITHNAIADGDASDMTGDVIDVTPKSSKIEDESVPVTEAPQGGDFNLEDM